MQHTLCHPNHSSRVSYGEEVRIDEYIPHSERIGIKTRGIGDSDTEVEVEVKVHRGTCAKSGFQKWEKLKLGEANSSDIALARSP